MFVSTNPEIMIDMLEESDETRKYFDVRQKNGLVTAFRIHTTALDLLREAGVREFVPFISKSDDVGYSLTDNPVDARQICKVVIRLYGTMV